MMLAQNFLIYLKALLAGVIMFIFTEVSVKQSDDKGIEGFILLVRVLFGLCLILMPWALLAILGDITGVVALSSPEFKVAVCMLLGAVIQIILCSWK